MTDSDGINIQPDRDLLAKLSQACQIPLTEQESESLNSILNELKDTQSRYDAPTLIETGGEKAIYRVYDRYLARFVAMAKPAKAPTRADQEQFMREGRLIANLAHPNIVPVHNIGIDSEGVPFFSMELISGDSLQTVLNQLKERNKNYEKQYALKTMLDLFNKVCDAVAYAHSRQVLHLDLKPENIQIGEFGEVFLCDWGISQVVAQQESNEPGLGQLDGDILNNMTLTGITKGTPGFMAPEQITGETKSEQTDIYALGAILYLILTHRLPVKGKSASEVVKNTKEGNIIHPNRPKHTIPHGLASIAMKALARLPEERYSSVQELQKDINRTQTGFATLAEGAGPLKRVVLLIQRHRNLTFWLMSVFALFSLLISIGLVVIHKEKRATEANYALYRKQTEKIVQFNQTHNILSFNSKYILGYMNANATVSILNEILALNTDPAIQKQLLSRKGINHFLLQQFNEAKATFEKLDSMDERTPNLLDLCRKYSEIKPNDNARLSDGQLATLLKDSASWGQSVFLCYYHLKQKYETNPEEYIELCNAMLARLNFLTSGNIREATLIERPEGYHLDLSHTLYSTYEVRIPLSWKFNLLTPLQLYSLDISHSPVSRIRELLDLKNITELKMVGVRFNPRHALTSLLRHCGVERVILGKGEYPKSVIQAIKDLGIEVIEEEETSPHAPRPTPAPRATVQSPQSSAP